jgi:hypothetical protein
MCSAIREITMMGCIGFKAGEGLPEKKRQGPEGGPAQIRGFLDYGKVFLVLLRVGSVCYQAAIMI